MAHLFDGDGQGLAETPHRAASRPIAPHRKPSQPVPALEGTPYISRKFPRSQQKSRAQQKMPQGNPAIAEAPGGGGERDARTAQPKQEERHRADSDAPDLF